MNTYRLRQHGITLIELMVALTIAMIISASLGALFVQSIKVREQVDKDGQRIETGRYAIESLGDDIRLAGFWGDYLPPATTTWSVADPCATAVADLGWNNALAPTVPVPIMGFEAHPANTPTISPAVATTTCLPNYKAGTDVLVLRRLSTQAYVPSAITAVTPLPSGGTRQGEVHMQSSTCSPNNTLDPVRFIVSDGGTANFTLHQVDCGTTLSPVRRVLVRIYYVATCNACSAAENPAIPTLKVAELTYSGGALQHVVRSVAPGVEDVHFEYGVDSTAGDGSADAYSESNANGLATGFNWQDVMSVKAYILARDLTMTASYSDTKKYELGAHEVQAPASALNYKRNVFSSTIRLTNVSGRRETP